MILVNERRFEMNKLSEGVDFNNLTYHYKDKSTPKYFTCFKDPLIIYNDIKNGRMSSQKEENIQEELQLEVNEIFKGNQDYNSEDQISAMKNIKKLYNRQEKVIKFYNDYTRMVSEAKCKSFHGEDLKY